MKKMIFIMVPVFCIIFALSLSGQGVRGGQISFDIDVATYRVKGEWSYAEVYFSVPRNHLTHSETGEIFEAYYEIGVNILLDDSLVSEKTWKRIDRADSLNQITEGQHLYDQTAFYLKENKYRIQARITDLLADIGGWYEMDLNVKNHSDSTLDMSDIQLSLGIARDTTKTVFYKNGYRIIPNPKAIYGIELPMLHYYSEIYNLAPYLEDKDSTYNIETTIHNSDNVIVKTLPEKCRLRAGTSLVDIGTINVATLISGAYQLQLKVIDNATADTVSKHKNFLVYRRQDFAGIKKVPESAHEAVNEFENMTEEQLDEQFDYCKIISTKEERSLYKKLNENSKRNFLKDFWQKRDDIPTTPFNEFKNIYMQRIQIAKDRYSRPSKEGWKSDQGKIIITYGEPDEIERFPSSMENRGYEIWYYFKIEGGVQFYFVDIQGLGSYDLVHSTALNNIHDYDWQRWIAP